MTTKQFTRSMVLELRQSISNLVYFPLKCDWQENIVIVFGVIQRLYKNKPV